MKMQHFPFEIGNKMFFCFHSYRRSPRVSLFNGIRVCPLLFLFFLSGLCLADAPGLLSVTPFRNQELEAYDKLKSMVVSGWTIPGLGAYFVPQGVDWVDAPQDEGSFGDGKFLILSGYIGEEFNNPRLNRAQRLQVTQQRSAVILVNAETGEPVSAARLLYRNGNPMRLHAGGIAVWNRSFWIPGPHVLYRFDLNELFQKPGEVITLQPTGPAVHVASRGSFVSVSGDSLLVGDFLLDREENPAYRQSPVEGVQHQAWTAVYLLDPETGALVDNGRYKTANDREVLIPHAVIHHRLQAQGIAVREDGLLALSVSYGNRDSRIAFYRPYHENRPLELPAPSTTALPDGTQVPSWTLHEGNWKETITAPPGSEGLAWSGARLAIAFEGGAYPYRLRWTRLEDRVLILDVPTEKE